MGQTKRHTFILVQTSKKGFRTEFQLKFNDNLLFGKVVKTKRKGQIVWQTHWKDKSVDRYDPQWLCRKNGRNVNVPMDHPSMWNVKQLQDAQAA